MWSRGGKGAKSTVRMIFYVHTFVSREREYYRVWSHGSACRTLQQHNSHLVIFDRKASLAR